MLKLVVKSGKWYNFIFMNLQKAALFLVSLPFTIGAKILNKDVVKNGNGSAVGVDNFEDRVDSAPLLQPNANAKAQEVFSANHIYDFSSGSGNYKIIDPSNDGIIRIDGVILDENARPKTFIDGDVHSTQWTLLSQGLDLDKNGNSLVIKKNDGDSTLNIAIEDYPFESQRAFGLTLGKTLDNGYVETEETLAVSYYFHGGSFLKSADQEGFYGLIYSHAQPSKNYFGHFDDCGKLIDQQTTYDDSESRNMGSFGDPLYFVNPVTNKNSLAVAFDLIPIPYDTLSHPAVGIATIDEDGNKKSRIFLNFPTTSLNPFPMASIIRNTDLFEVTYLDNNQCYLQLLDVDTLNEVASRIAIPAPANCPFSQSTGAPSTISFSNGNQLSAARWQPVMKVSSPKLRDLNYSEIIPNYSSSELSPNFFTNPDIKRSIISMDMSRMSKILVTQSNDSVTLVRGYNLKVGSEIFLPVNNLSEVKIYSSDSLPYSLDDVLAPDFKPNSLSQINAESISVRHQQPFAIAALPKDQLVVLVGANATEVAQSMASYFKVFEVTNSPSLQPSPNPSFHPSGEPSIKPNSNPSGQPSFEPSVFPSTAPSSNPNSRPSGKPSTSPNSQPSEQPNFRKSEPTANTSPLIPTAIAAVSTIALAIMYYIKKKKCASDNRVHNTDSASNELDKTVAINSKPRRGNLRTVIPINQCELVEIGNSEEDIILEMINDSPKPTTNTKITEVDNVVQSSERPSHSYTRV